ncbi:MAG: hypothetical protein ACI4EA_00095, partial [Candidatus Ornithomonoglobus sp.]
SHETVGNDGYKFTPRCFCNLANRFMHELTNDEAYNVYSGLKTKIAIESEYISGSGNVQEQDEINAFDALLVAANDMLTIERGEPVSKYERILEWREASHEIDPDLYICAFLAHNDRLCALTRTDFFWKPVISHNNIVLKRVLDRGISENHFHLNGAAQYFPLSWISLMNNSESAYFRHKLLEIGSDRLNHEYSNFDYNNDSVYLRLRKAAALRLFLFYKIVDIKLTEDDKAPAFLTYDGIYRILNGDENLVEILCMDIDSYIAAISELKSNNDYDYASYPVGKMPDVNEYFCGERWLMYNILFRIYSKNRKYRYLNDLFHIYILLKESVRSELIQNNSVIGFGNFNLFQNRKSYFTDNTATEKIYQRTAIIDTLRNQKMIRSLEARVAPRDSAEEYDRYFRNIDTSLMRFCGGKAKESYMDRFFYVIHFIKHPDDERNMDYDVCQDSYVRSYVQRQAMALIRFREYYPRTARRVRGIDAANTEIGCRPEVFAQAFRALSGHEYTDSETGKKVSGLRKTYHVGEDFLDITDGLRAIDEAVSFFNMKCGDRLGHALALGINVEEWYALKKGHINICQQDYLDNVVWLYFKIIEYRIDVDNALIPFLENEFLKYSRIIYLSKLSEKSQTAFNINTYYNAWKLRGDNPELYITGEYKNPYYTDLWEWNAINREFPADKRIRKSRAVAYLYYCYHYNEEIKREGNRKIEVSIPRMMQEAVAKVQNKLQGMVACKGLCIETNPSSNCLIGSFGKYKYSNHPIINFYDTGLGIKRDEDFKCHHISVCINTDDQSVFGTSLENEYALMVHTLEKEKDENGVHKYEHTGIYNWIDAIRMMGNEFSFNSQ